MPSISVNGTRLNYIQRSQVGPGLRRDLVLCHGLAASLGAWPADLVSALTQTFRVTLFDMRGHGRSDRADGGYTAANLGQDLVAFLDALDIEAPHILAHSFGGVAALAVADRGRFASLTVLDSQIGLGRRLATAAGKAIAPDLAEALQAAGIQVDVADPYAGVHLITALAAQAVEDGGITSDDPRVQFLARSCPISTARRWLALTDTTSAIADLTAPDAISPERLAKADVPTLALYGANSPACFTGQALADHMPNCAFQTIPEAGHFFVATRVDDVLAHTTAFWGTDTGTGAMVA